MTQAPPTPADPAAKITALQQRWADEELDDAIDDLAGSVDELAELARANRRPSSKSAELEVEISVEHKRAQTAIATIAQVTQGRRS